MWKALWGIQKLQDLVLDHQALVSKKGPGEPGPGCFPVQQAHSQIRERVAPGRSSEGRQMVVGKVNGARVEGERVIALESW